MEKVRQGLLLRDKLIAEQRMEEVRALERSVFLVAETGVDRLDEKSDDDDDRYSLLSPKERLRCVSEMEKSVDSLAVNADATSSCGANAELMLRCIRAMQLKRPTPCCIVSSAEVTIQLYCFC